MSSLATSPSTPDAEVAYPPRSKGWKVARNTAFTVVCWSVAAMSVVILAALLISIVRQGWAHLGWSFLTEPPSRTPGKAGMGPAIFGTIWICALCAIVSLPLGVGTAIFLEEFKPRSRFLLRCHGFVQLNIANLAGVPAIVYGIIGLAVFVQMFNVFGNPNEPAFEFGVTWYDEYYDESGAYLRAEVDGRDAETTVLTNGMSLINDDGEPVTLTLVDPDTWTWPEPETVAAGTLLADAEAQRVPDESFAYFRFPFGRGVLAGALTLVLVILPIVIVSSQEAIRAVPSTLREGAFGLGCTRWQVVRRITLPAAIPGITTGAILAMSRAIGEAAPILVIAGIVYITFSPGHLMDEFTAMPLQIYDWAGRPQAAFHEVAASGIIVLLAVLLTFNATAVLIRQKFTRPLS